MKHKALIPTDKSPSRLRTMYEARRRNLPPMGTRSRPAMVITAVFAMSLISILTSLTWVQRSDLDYLRDASSVKIMDNLKWDVNLPGRPTQKVDFLELAAISVSDLKGKPYTLTAIIPTAVIASIKPSVPEESIVLVLPAFAHQEAILQTTWTDRRHFASSEGLNIAFPPLVSNSEFQTVTLTLTPTNIQKTIINSSTNQIPMFFSGSIRYQRYNDFLLAKRVGSGKQLADIGRIVLALFSVLLFLFIDSSPECLGLGMFMSLKALGVVASQRWFPDAMFSPWVVAHLQTYFLGFADFMQLYFFTQLARLNKPRPMAWLAAGAMFGAIYSLGMGIQTLPGEFNWSHEIWRYRNILIGLGCLACALPVSALCLKDKHYHRAAALLLASTGVLVQVITPLIIDIPGVSDQLWYKTWYASFETLTPYVFALSTFINVSTLEKRVKTLTDNAINAKVMEQQLELAKAVQETFFKIPTMPPGVSLAISHRAEMYVSGDMIYSYHDKNSNAAIALICDVTGHGLHAALKASICSVICDSIWDVERLRQSDTNSSRLEILHDRASGFFAKTAAMPDILAVVGCEVSLKEKQAIFYRANAVYPLLISKSSDGAWEMRLIIGDNVSVHKVQLTGHSFIVLFTDGLIDSSRTYKHFTDWLRSRLPQEQNLTAERLKELMLSFERWVETHDDRTMCVLEVA